MYKQAYLSNIFQKAFSEEVKLGIFLKFDEFSDLINSEPFDLLLFSANRFYPEEFAEKHGLYCMKLQPHVEGVRGLTYIRDEQKQFDFYLDGERIPVLAQDEWYEFLHEEVFKLMCTRFYLCDIRNL